MAYVPTEPFAAVDLGSNSFHMIVANFADGRLQVVDKIKEMVRLASGLDKKQNLSDESMQSALECLERFGQRIREIPRLNVRAVGTNTLRQARNGKKFLAQASQALGHPIEIIAGREEARLVYLGVAHTVYDENTQRLVVDIGGGSTELIIGKGFSTKYTESLYMGCVNVSRRFFPDNKITEKKMRSAILFARQELEVVETLYKKAGWKKAIGSSGTIRSISDILKNQGWSTTGIDAAGLDKLQKHLIKVGDSEKIELAELADRRRPVFAGGVAVLRGIFDAFELDLMTVSDGALREGLLHELIGRAHDEDVRDKTIADLSLNYNIDKEQADRVKRTALHFFEQSSKNWQLNKKEHKKLLRWGAELHEIGLSIAHSQHHRHGAYLMAHSDLPGFSQQDQRSLAMLIRSHRRKFPLDEFKELIEEHRDSIFRLSILLRLAVVLHRSRFYTGLPEITLEFSTSSLKLLFPKDWLENQPLTRTDLETEKEFLSAANFTIEFE